MARILITGCSSGIGRAAAERLAAGGHFVIATARREQDLRALNVALKLPMDVTSVDSVAAAVRASGPVDVLINNAGISLWSPLELCPPEQIERLFATNVFGAIWTTQAVLPGMRERRRGRIIQISSSAARRPGPLLGSYAASKAALEALSLSLRFELHAIGIFVTVLGMSAVATRIGANRYVHPTIGTDYEDIGARTRRRIAALTAEPAGAREVGAVIERIIDAPVPPLRVYVGEATGPAMDAIAAQSDEEYDAAMLASLGYPPRPPHS